MSGDSGSLFHLDRRRLRWVPRFAVFLLTCREWAWLARVPASQAVHRKNTLDWLD
jgi:hypothetical protein